MSNAKYLIILATSLNVLHNYFYDLTKLFSDLYPAKFIDTLAKSFFSCVYFKNNFKKEITLK